jgi:16S rRNA (guanine966-N2)-methyltransferase
MRVIGGTYRSRRLVAPRGITTRPTSDRLRETLFNVLAPSIDGAVFADLYAGSGAVGIEALSRGAQLVYFVDQAPEAVAALRENLKQLMAAQGPCAIIFLDPPYAASDDYTRTMTTIGKSADTLLAPDGIVVAEHNRQMQNTLAEQYGSLQRYRLLVQGDAQLSFYRSSPAFT